MKIFNSLTRQKEPFQPIEPGKVRMYVCGMTVYDLCHIGHARVMVVFDTVLRWLRANGYEVTYVRNITDIDDKIIHRAQERGEPFEALTARFIEAMHEDLGALGVLPPTHEPRATAAIEDIIALVQTLLDKGYAYVGDKGDVYYDINRFSRYGRLSNRKMEDLRAGARIDIEEAKRDPLDFVLWKMAKPDEPSWPSPWGAGRPGWHIECSAMSTRCLGAHFDIHGGGMDLKFPHHENEIAQSEAASGHRYVNLWMHNGFVQVDNEKMSKSLGNFFTIREVLAHYAPEVVRLFILSSHYRGPLNYTEEHLDQARTSLTRLYGALRDLPVTEPVVPLGSWYDRFAKHMDDDFNTAGALAVLFKMAREANILRTTDMQAACAVAATLKHCAGLLGLLQATPEDFLQHQGDRRADSADSSDAWTEERIAAAITARLAARKAKNFAEADAIRAQLQAAGIVLEDGPTGTTWRRAS